VCLVSVEFAPSPRNQRVICVRKAPQIALKRLIDTPPSRLYIDCLPMSVSKIQIGQLWKKDGTDDIYLVTRVYSEALSTVAILRKSGAEGEAHVRAKVERTPQGQTIQGFKPAMDDDSF